MTLWRGTAPLVLASASVARGAILAAAGLPFTRHPAAIDERAVEAESAAAEAGPDDVARLLARRKALSVSASMDPSRYVIGADQTLALGGTLFHKAPDRAAAQLQLQRLQGRTHALHAALAVVQGETVLFETVATARLTMRPLSEAQIGAYLDAAGRDALASVGCYQIEGLGVHLFSEIDGDHFTICGLPLLPLLGFLRQEGLVT